MSGSKKSVEYLELKLKSMDIDVTAVEMEDEILLQIIMEIQ